MIDLFRTNGSSPPNSRSMSRSLSDHRPECVVIGCGPLTHTHNPRPDFLIADHGSVVLFQPITGINDRLGGPFTDWRLCPHMGDDGCACRKPRPGMFLDLASAHAIDLAASVHVGDSDKDAAAAAGIPTFHWAWEFFRPGRSSPSS